MTDPLNGPFPTSGQLTDYSDEPGYAIRAPAAAREAVLPREMADALRRFEPRQSDDPVKTDLELTCRECGLVLCDIQPGDDFNILVEMALEHECATIS